MSKFDQRQPVLSIMKLSAKVCDALRLWQRTWICLTILTLSFAAYQDFCLAQVRIVRSLSLSASQDPFGFDFGGEFSDYEAAMIEAEETPAAEQSADPDAAQANARKQMRDQLIKAIKFDRRPSTILTLWAEAASPAETAEGGEE